MIEKFKGNLPSQEEKIEYSTDFMNKVKEVFPDSDPASDRMHKALESGGKLVGRLLQDVRARKSAEAVKVMESGDQEKIIEMARKVREIYELHEEWRGSLKK